MRLTAVEEKAIIDCILDPSERGFPSPRLFDVKAMADALVSERCQLQIGSNWGNKFEKRCQELTMKLNRMYDYRSAGCKDPIIIKDWFLVAENTKARFGILDEDLYNFHESGFMMRIISTASVVTSAEY